MILAGDVGGTKVHLALYNSSGALLQAHREQKYPAHEFASLEEVISRFLLTHAIDRRDISAACFGCPGPAHAGRVSLTNLPWTLDVGELAKILLVERTFLINDLEANAYGIPEVGADRICTLHEGSQEAVGNRGLISAGTGLGEALLIWDGAGRHIPIPSEGGHCDFAPRNERETALLVHLRDTLKKHISFERVVSGIGIRNIYKYLRDVEKIEEPIWLRERLREEDPNAVIGECAENETSAICSETMEMFSSAYGAEAGNLALKVMAFGGIYLGGGIAPKILKTLRKGPFLKAFLDKGRLKSLMEQIPVHVIADQSCAVLGAAAYARERAPENLA